MAPKGDTHTTTARQLVFKEAQSDEDYGRAYPLLCQLVPGLDLKTYHQRLFAARDAGYRMFIAEIGGKIIGMIGLAPNHNIHDGSSIFIEQTFIDSAHRGCGYGAMLLEFAENYAKEQGFNLVELDLDFNDDAAEEFYLRHGYRASGRYLYKEWQPA